MDAIQHYFEEEAFYYHTLHDFKCLVDLYGDRVFDELEHYAPELYEAWSAHKANNDIAEFLSNKYNDEDCDYWKKDTK